MLTTLTIREPPDIPLPRVIPELACPLMTICMKYTDGKYNTWHPLWQKIPFENTSVDLAADIIQDTNVPMFRELAHDGVDKGKGIELLFTRGPHTGIENHMIMSTDRSYNPSVGEMCPWCLYSIPISCHKGLTAGIK